MRYRLIALVLAACHAKANPGAPCATVAMRFVHVARAELGSGDDALRRGAAAQLPGIAAALERACSDGNWSAAARDCMVGADDAPALEACERQLTDDQRRALDR
jgi:hypothetical protein